MESPPAEANNQNENESFEVINTFPLSDSLRYPFRGTGAYMLVIGTIFLAPMVLFYKFFSYICVFAELYMMVYFFDVIQSTIHGEKDPPEWPLFKGWMSIFFESVAYNAIIIISFLPTLIYYFLCSSSSQKMDMPIVAVTLIWTFFYFPMSMIVAAETRNFAALLPPVVIVAIVKAPKMYYLLCLINAAVLCAFAAIVGVLNHFATSFITKTFAGVLSTLIGIYCMMVICRILGLFFKEITNR